MTRARKFLHGVSSGYLVLGLNASYTLASVPLVLSYLSQNEFGIWIVVSQMTGYLSMVDFGTNTAGVRLLIDHKDTPASGAYGSLIKTLGLVQCVQAGLIIIAGVAVTTPLALLLRIDAELVSSFRILWFWQVGFLAVNFILRLAGQLLMAHQRIDVTNYAQAVSFVVNFVVLWASLAAGLKLYSFVLAHGAATLLSTGWGLGATVRLRLLPPRNAWGLVSAQQFRALFGFGAQMFLVALGTQLILTSQMFLVTRWYGVGVASVWSIMTKLFLLALQVVQRIVGASMLAFAEMLVRQEQELLWRRYRSLFELLVLAACYMGLLLAVGNTAFVHLWTNGKIQWPAINDWLLAVWFVLLSQMCLHNSLILMTKEVRGLKFIYFMEGLLFLASAILVGRHFGITGMLACSIICTMGSTLAYGTWRIAVLRGEKFWRVVRDWSRVPARFLAFTLPVAGAVVLLTPVSSLYRLTVALPILALVALFIAVRLCTPRELARELASHLPALFRKPLLMLSGGAMQNPTPPSAP
jgi:O-antigen/teichoic acid export membrane protein